MTMGIPQMLCFFQIQDKVKINQLQINEQLNRTIFICFIGIQFTPKNPLDLLLSKI